MDFIYKSHYLDWKLFTIIVSDKYTSWILGAYMLLNPKDRDIITEFL